MTDETRKQIVVISRHWDNPIITVKITDNAIGVEMSVEDFCKAIVAEVPHPLFTVSRAQLQKNVLGVVQKVLNKAKESTAYV